MRRLISLVLLVLMSLPLGACPGRPFEYGNIPPDTTLGGPDCKYVDGKYVGCNVVPRQNTRTVVVFSGGYGTRPLARGTCTYRGEYVDC